jgi:hypothetical protein
MLEELASLKMPAQQTMRQKPKPVVQWNRPGDGWFKVNTDAAFDPHSCIGSAGVVIRDHLGQVHSVAARWYEAVPDALTAKAMATKEGLELAVENGYDQIILEVDCRNLKTLIEDHTGLRSSIGGPCFDITELGRSFSDFRVAWVCRDANSVAHCCASTVLAMELSHFWLDYILEWLLGLAAADCTPVIN